MKTKNKELATNARAKKLNVLYIAEDISLPGFHGGSTHVQETIAALEELGHKVFVICKRGEKQKETESKGKVTYLRINLPKSGMQKNLYLFFNLGKFFEETLKKEKIDLVWQRNRIFGCQGIIAGKKAGTKTILEMNEPIETAEGSAAFPLIKKWFFHCVKYADKVTGTHECMFRNIEKEKQLLTWHGSNPALFNPTKKNAAIIKKFDLKGKTLFYSGSFQEWHCLKNALLAFKEVQKKIPEATFLLAGEGKQKKEIEDFVAEQEIQRVHFLGNVPFEKLAYYINASDACVALFDRTFGAIKKLGYYYSPIKVFDAMACGKPVIASNIGNLKEIIMDKKGSLLTDERKTSNISTAMIFALSRSSLIKRIKQKNLLSINKKHNWKQITSRILSLSK